MPNERLKKYLNDIVWWIPSRKLRDFIRELVDTIGGVYFDVPIDMDYDDSSQKLYIHLKQGYQLLDGDKAEQLVRFRKNNNYTGYSATYGSDDYGRMRTQREFIIAALKQTLQAKNVLKLGELIDIANRNIETNMNISELKDYLPYIMEFNTDNIKTGALPGASEKPGEVWIFVHNKKKTEQMVGELFLDKPTEEEIKENSKTNIEILYVEDKVEEADRLQETLEEQGYKITKEKIAAAPKTIIINRKQMTEENTKKIQKLVLNAQIEEGEDNGQYHYTIIVGKDYKGN